MNIYMKYREKYLHKNNRKPLTNCIFCQISRYSKFRFIVRENYDRLHIFSLIATVFQIFRIHTLPLFQSNYKYSKISTLKKCL